MKRKVTLLFIIFIFLFASVLTEAASNRFTNNGDGTITDAQTGLMWQQDGSASGKLNWEEARKFCRGLTLGGRSEWRLPTVEEIKGLIKGHFHADIAKGAERPYLMLNKVGFKNIQDDWYWSGSTFDVNDGNSWLLHMYFGYAYIYNKTYMYNCFVLAVHAR